MSRSNRLTVTFAVIACLAAPALADCVDYQGYLHRSHLSHYPDLFIYDGGLFGDVLVTAVHDPGLATMPMQDGRPGEILDTLDTPAGVTALTVSGDLVFAASWQGVVTTARVDAAGQLTHLAHLALEGTIRGLCVCDPDLLLAAGSEGLTLIDVSDPAAPVVRSIVACGDGQDVDAAGVIAHVAVAGFGVRSFDVGDPDAPFLLAHIPLVGGASALDLAGGRLAVTSYAGNLHVLDVSAPWAPVLTHGLDIQPELVVMAGDRIYAVWDGTFAVIELDQAGGGQVIGRLNIERGENAMIPLDEAMLLVGSNYAEVVDFSVPYSYEPATLPLDVQPIDFAITDDRIVTVELNGWLRVYGRDVEGTPYPQGEVFLGPIPEELVVAGDWAFVGDQGSEMGLTGVDLSDPTAPVVAWTLPLDRLHRNLALDGDLLGVLCAGGGGLYVIDVSDPAAPVQRGHLSYDGYDLALAGDVAYVAANLSGLAVIDLADPDHPALVRTVETAELPRSVAVSGDLMVTLDYNYGISTLSLADPLWPVMLGSSNAPRGAEGEVVILDQHAYVSSWWMGFLVYDLADPAAPELLGGVHGPRSRIEVGGDNLYTTSAGTDLLTFPQQCGALVAVDPGTVGDESRPAAAAGTLGIVDVAPNPCNPATRIRFHLAEAGPVRCRVADLRGRCLATLTDGWRTAGEHVLQWSGRDAAGRSVAAGTYLIRVEAGTDVRTARVSLVK